MEQVTFKLQIFEGPLDLLMHLIQKNKVSICDIPITLITTQYFEYIEQMKELDLEITGEFIVMASHLLLIKSKMLLPKVEELEEDDPRAELIDRLLEYQKIKGSVEFFAKSQHNSHLLYFKEPDKIERPPMQPFEGTIPLSELVKAFNDLLERKERVLPPKREAFEVIVKRDLVSIRSRIHYLKDLLHERKHIPFDELFGNIKSRPEAISTFLALLELIRSGRMLAVYEQGKIICKLVGDNIEFEGSTSSN